MTERMVLMPEHNENLAFMECFASCVLTYLKLTGRDHRPLLLDYWNIGYERRTLLSSKHASDLPLGELYGLRLRFMRGGRDKLAQAVGDDGAAIVLCSASKLDYFPRRYLAMEETGFGHAILVAGWDAASQSYDVADPVVHRITRLTADQIVAAAADARRGELHLFAIGRGDAPFAPPTRRELLASCTQRIMQAYANVAAEAGLEANRSPMATGETKAEAWMRRFRTRSGGLQAWRLFERDLADSVTWPEPARSGWVKRNAMMIGSIRELRGRIWATYRDYGQLGGERAETGGMLLEELTGAWTALCVDVFKYGRDRGRAADVLTQTANVRQSELRFLTWLHAAVREGEGAHAAGTTR